MDLRIERLSGPDLAKATSDLARLRIAVFAEFPYLYEGDPAYEGDYLRAFAADEDGILVVARDGDRIVGAATASSLSSQPEAFQAPFFAHGIDPASAAYFGESVLLSRYRGQGAGHAFFDAREAHARARGARVACFAAVIRPHDHPARPAGYRSLDAFWRRRGYEPVPGLVVNLSWKERGHRCETDHALQVWTRPLG